MANENVSRFFEILAAYQEASRQAYDERDAVARRDGVGLCEAQEDAGFNALQERATHLYLAMEAMTPHVIRENLARLGLEDLVVTAVIRSRYDGMELGRKEMLLSDVCGLRYQGVAMQMEIWSREMDLRVHILRDGQPIGHVDSDGDFDYEAAPDLKTALGWKVATDGGRTRLIEGFDLDSAAQTLLETVRMNGTGKDAFFGAWMSSLKKVFVYEKTSRFGDGYCGAASTLWRVATRELGQRHEGYSFCY